MAPVRCLCSTRVAAGFALLWALGILPAALYAKSGPLPWRPESVVGPVFRPDRDRALTLMKDLSYSEDDADRVSAIVSAMGPVEASRFLLSYISQYDSGKAAPNEALGRALFCLGIVQTPEAKATLLDRWDRYDRQLDAEGTAAAGSLCLAAPWVLAAIGDALHFYLADPSARKWFEDRIAEAEKMPELSPVASPGKDLRRVSRVQLLAHLYRWDLVESVDGNPLICAQHLLPSFVHEQHVLPSYAQSAANALAWIKQLKPHRLDVTEQEWVEKRRSFREFVFDEVAYSLGRPLALEMWRTYLRGNTLGQGTLKDRLWFTTCAGFVQSLGMDAAPLWMPTSEEDAYLHDVLQYTKEMPKGKMRGLMMRMLYSATSYCGDVETVGSIRDIQAAASTLMTGDDRRSVQLGVQNARAERAALLEKLNAAQRSSRPAPASGPANDASEKLSELKKQREAYLRAQEGRTTKSQPQNTP